MDSNTLSPLSALCASPFSTLSLPPALPTTFQPASPLTALTDFRRDLYACFRKAGDVLMNTVDALLSHTQAQSVIELTLASVFQRQWSRLYDAFQNADIDRNALRALLMRSLPRLPGGRRRVFGVDASSIPRPLSGTARDRR